VSHITGYIHTVYNKATINKKDYLEFTARLNEFVSTHLTPAVFINFLRFKSVYKCLFQYHDRQAGGRYYIPLEKLYEYEHSSKWSVNEETRDKLLAEVDSDEFFADPVPGKIIINEVEDFLKKHRNSDLKVIETEFLKTFSTEHTDCVTKMFADIRDFTVITPALPSPDKDFVNEPYPEITVTDSREDIIRKVRALAGSSEMALLSLYAYRDMALTDWRPFIKAAIERNPVCHAQLGKKTPDEIYHIVNSLKNKSIYDDGRMAQPDEVWNFGRGDGAEKAFLMADAIIHSDPAAEISIVLDNGVATLDCYGKTYSFVTTRGHNRKIRIHLGDYSVA
jgi:hypothetical protein